MARELHGFKAWPQNPVALSTERVVQMYHEGFAGAYQDPEESDALDHSIVAAGGDPDGAATAERYGFAGSGAGKLVLLYPAVVKCYGLRALTKPGQQTGDCTSMMIRDLGLKTICLEDQSGLPDEVSGKVEKAPQVSDTAAANGVFSNEGVYLSRGHNDQGMSCSQGIRYVTTQSGLVIRQKYEQADLERYNVNFELRGRSGSPAWLNEIGRMHPIRQVTRPKGYEAARDFMHQGKATGVCSGLSFSDQRDQYGHSKRTAKGWAHAWHWGGYDDRPETVQHFGEPQILAGHRWAIWNRGGREIFQSADYVPQGERQLWETLGLCSASTGNILIPEGYWWFDASLAGRCDIYSVSGATGWAAKTLPDYSPGAR